MAVTWSSTHLVHTWAKASIHQACAFYVHFIQYTAYLQSPCWVISRIWLQCTCINLNCPNKPLEEAFTKINWNDFLPPQTSMSGPKEDLSHLTFSNLCSERPYPRKYDMSLYGTLSPAGNNRITGTVFLIRFFERIFFLCLSKWIQARENKRFVNHLFLPASHFLCI